MKTEGQLNAELSKRLRALHPKTFHIKVADKFTLGISDFIIWNNGKTMALETKFIKELPSMKAKLLSHPFSGPQKTFLESMAMAGISSYGLVVIIDKAYLVDYKCIPENGNWNTQEFLKQGFSKYSLWGELMEVFHDW